MPTTPTARKPKPAVASLFQGLADDFSVTKVVATEHEYRDTFDRAHSRISVELCAGVWHTFHYQFRGLGDPSVRAHQDRDAARTFAVAFLGRAS